MNLLICLITYNRLDYTKRTLKNLLDTLPSDREHFVIVVDNNSTDGTKEWLKKELSKLKKRTGYMLNKENFYPGRACNMGWFQGLGFMQGATHLMRLDNDMELESNWFKKVEDYFEAMPPLGQLGLDNSALSGYSGDQRYLTAMGGKTINAWPGNIGGPCVIRREVWDKGARYDETPWKDLREDETKMITPQEDVKFSLSMHKYGYIYGHPTEKLGETFATAYNRDDYPEYYKKTFKERGYPI